MSILLHPFSERDEWFEALSTELPDMRVQLWPDIDDPDSIEYAVFWVHDTEDLLRYPNLRAILAVTAGVEQFRDGGYPDVPIVRLADAAMGHEMAAYALHWTVHFHRHMDTYLEEQAAARWRTIRAVAASDFPVGILGFGNMGRLVAAAHSSVGYPTRAWSRTGGQDAGVIHYRGLEEMEAFLGACRVVVNVLPLTPDTKGLMNAERFSWFREGALYISIGRGPTTIDTDLVAALDHGPLGTAVLDVTDPEPLPSDSPLWRHPRVRITPHASGLTRARTAGPLIAANIRRIRRGEQPYPLFDRQRDY